MEGKLTFHKILRGCLSHIHQKNLLPKFKRLKTNEERIRFCLEDSFLKSSLLLWLKETCLNMLLLEVVEDSVQLREQGNLYFKRQDYIKSAVLYTRSVEVASDDDRKSLALANRSFALFKLGAFNDCLQDIELALAAGYPERLRPKVLLRKGSCFLELRRYGDFEKTVKDLNSFTDAWVVAEVEKLKKMERCPPCERNEIAEWPCLYLGEDENMPNVSAAVEIQCNEEKGRFFVAKKKITVGDFLIVGSPYVALLSEDFHKTHCHFCIRKLTVDKRVCTGCAEAWFCDGVCRDSALKQFHKFECGKLQSLNSIQLPHVGLRVVLAAGIDSLLGGRAMSDERYQRVFGLVNHLDKLDPVELVQHSLSAALFTMLVAGSSLCFPEEPSVEEKYKIGGIILHHVLQVNFNARTIESDVATQSNLRDDGSFSSPSRKLLSSVLHLLPRQQFEPLAVTLYPASSYLNHSCDPTVVHTFYNGALLVARSVKDVELGEEITTTYGPHFRSKGRTERLQSLKSRYLFTCKCYRCADTEVENYQDSLASYKCCKCGGPLRNIPMYLCHQKTPCRKCNQPQTTTNQMMLSTQADELERQATRAVERSDWSSAAEYFTRCVTFRREALYQGHIHLARSAGCLAVCLAECGEFDESWRYLKLSLDSYEEQFGPLSHEFAVLLDKLTDRYLEALRESTPPKNVYGKLEELVKEAAYVLAFYNEPGSEILVLVNRKLAHIAVELGK